MNRLHRLRLFLLPATGLAFSGCATLIFDTPLGEPISAENGFEPVVKAL